MKTILTTAILIMLGALSAGAQVADTLLPPLTDAYLDTVQIKKNKGLNNYTMIGVNYGASFSYMQFNPAKHGQSWRVSPQYMSVMFTHYEKMFDYLPYFAFQAGVAYGHEGYVFPLDKENPEYTTNADGATEMDITVVEVPALAQVHMDATFFKFMVNAGIYGGYRLSIDRSGPLQEPAYAKTFRDYEHRFDYGLQGGAGFGLIFSPVEIHFNVLARYSWSSLYDADYASPYYYRFAYPLDIMATVGIHIQLTKRSGKTTGQLKRDAKDFVLKKNERD